MDDQAIGIEHFRTQLHLNLGVTDITYQLCIQQSRSLVDRVTLWRLVLDTILSLISEYGTLIYLLLFGYCALKSGALPLFGGYAAQAGALDVGYVALATFAGGYLGDELRFMFAKRYGLDFVKTRPRLAALFAKAKVMMENYGTAYIFLYRYPKGMRTIGALPIGLTDIDWYKFTPLNGASALLWTALLVGAGYLFGSAIEQAVKDGWGIASVALLIVFIALSVLAWQRVTRIEAVAKRD